MRLIRKRSYLVLLCAASFALSVTDACAQWIVDGTEVCTATGVQQEHPISSNTLGGAMLAWIDNRSGTNNIYMQRVNEYGSVQWTVDGVAVCTSTGDKNYPSIIHDGVGGAIVAWEDYFSAVDYDIYAQRVDASGMVQWTTTGVALCLATADQQRPKIVPDGAGGAIAVWRDDRNGIDADIYAQRVDASGTVQWMADGVAICTAAGDQQQPKIVSDSAGGAIITWQDYRSGNSYDIYAQRIDSSGEVLWTADGESLCSAAMNQTRPEIASDGVGGAIVTWMDYRSGKDVYAQSIDAYGAIRWAVDGEAVCTAADDQNRPMIVSDGFGGAIIVWGDDRGGTDRDIYAQRLDPFGTAVWAPNGESLCTAIGDQTYPTIISDGAEGAIVTWQDERAGVKDIYVQRVDFSGVALWTPDGIALCTAIQEQLYPVIASDGSGGAIIAWRDERNGTANDDIFAQRVTRQGHWGYPCPSISAVLDIPADEGGSVAVHFSASRLDVAPDFAVDYYTIWHALYPADPSAMMTDGISLNTLSEATPALTGKAFYSSAKTDWALVGSITATQLAAYEYVVETMHDSTDVDSGWEYFFVAAHDTTAESLDFWDSPPDSGYSADNMRPGQPQALAAEYIRDSGLHLHWKPNTEPDLDHYALYRGTVPDFAPDEASCIGTATDTSFTDTAIFVGEYCYKVSAVDIHDNEGPHAVLTPDMINGIPGGRPHYNNLLFQNSPNPFTLYTQIAFSIKEAGHVRLRIFDAKGRLVRVLVDEVRQPNDYIELWDGRDLHGKQGPAGTYFYNIESPGWKASKKMTLAR